MLDREIVLLKIKALVNNEDPSGCSFCGTSLAKVALLIKGPGAAICDACVMNANQAIHDKAIDKPGAKELPIVTV